MSLEKNKKKKKKGLMGMLGRYIPQTLKYAILAMEMVKPKQLD
jgi:hypothetical protein